jgi:3-methyladenine DNA glycosylase AlkD
MKERILNEIIETLENNVPNLTDEKRDWMYTIINPDINDYIIYGVKNSVIEKIIRNIDNKYKCSYPDVVDIFKHLTRSNIEEQKIAGFYFLNRYKKNFNANTIDLFKIEYSKHCHTWSHCDSTCIRVLGPYLAKKGNEELAKSVINDWSNSDYNWIKRASIVILLKIVMLKKDFDENYVYNLVNKMLKYSNQNYIEKAIGWLIKTCSKYKPELIFDYLMRNKKTFSRLILRYASEKLPEDKREEILLK